MSTQPYKNIFWKHRCCLLYGHQSLSLTVRKQCCIMFTPPSLIIRASPNAKNPKRFSKVVGVHVRLESYNMPLEFVYQSLTWTQTTLEKKILTSEPYPKGERAQRIGSGKAKMSNCAHASTSKGAIYLRLQNPTIWGHNPSSGGAIKKETFLL